MVKNKNCGWYIIPYSINSNRKEYDKMVNENLEPIKKFENCRYLFSYIYDLYNNGSSIKCYKADVNKCCFEFKYQNEHMDDPYIIQYETGATVEDINVFEFSDYLGFIAYKINYNDLTSSDIVEFSYINKRGGTLIENAKKLLGTRDIKLHFYSCSPLGSCASILQMVYYDGLTSKDGLERFALGRGYNHSFIRGTYTFEESDYDDRYSPYDYVQWRFCQNLLTVTPDVSRTEVEYFLDTVLPSSIDCDYLAMYLFLLNQRYSLMYLLSRIIKTKDERALTDIEKKLNSFKVTYSFKTVSNEMVYQNIYDKLYKIMSIDSLIADVQDSSARISTMAEKKAINRDRRMNYAISGLAFLAIFSALIDASDYFDRLRHGHDVVNTWTSLVVVVAIIAIIIGIALINKIRINIKK